MVVVVDRIDEVEQVVDDEQRLLILSSLDPAVGLNSVPEQSDGSVADVAR
jgi:hypothetical protein